MERETIKDEPGQPSRGDAATPGVVLVFSGSAAAFHVLPLRRGALELGRDELAALRLSDGRVSRRHLHLDFDGATWIVADRGSTNGVFVDGALIGGEVRSPGPRVIRIGHTLLVPCADVTPLALHGMAADEREVVGPRLRAIADKIGAIGRAGQNLLITGPSGAGKELAARRYHAAGERGRVSPFVALNCAAIPDGLAERVLFGAKRGAYSGAVQDAVGLLQAADGGTLFLDEIAELDLAIQAKLLRVLETREVLPIGAVQPTTVDFRMCAATLKDLRAEVRAGRFREDLYFRIGRPELRLPSLAERPEEIPWLIARALAGVGAATPDVELVEACLLRPWPGNVRELLAELRGAAIAAGDAPVVRLAHLPMNAGANFDDPATSPSAAVAPGHPIGEALREAGGNVSKAAAMLGISRAKVRRFIDKASLDLDALRRK